MICGIEKTSLVSSTTMKMICHSNREPKVCQLVVVKGGKKGINYSGLYCIAQFEKGNANLQPAVAAGRWSTLEGGREGKSVLFLYKRSL